MKPTKRLLKKLFKVNLSSSALDTGFFLGSLLYLFLLGRLLPADPTLPWVQDNVVFLSALVIAAFTGIVALYAYTKRIILAQEYGMKTSFWIIFRNSFIALFAITLLIGMLSFLSATPLLTLPFTLLAAAVLLAAPVFMQVLQVKESFARAAVFLVEGWKVVMKSAGVLFLTTLKLFVIMVILQRIFIAVTGTDVGATLYYVYNTLFTVYLALSYLWIVQVHRRYVLLNRTKF